MDGQGVGANRRHSIGNAREPSVTVPVAQDADHGRRAVENLVQGTLAAFQRDHPPPLYRVPPRMRDLLACLHERLFDRHLSVTWLRDHCRIRDHNVSCQFHHAMGVAIREYIERLRLEAADQLMDSGIVTVSRAAQSVGYTHLQTYYRAFARYSDATPGNGGRAMPRSVPPRPPDGTTVANVLPPDEREELGAAMYRVIPSDGDPGAREANVLGYVDWITRQPSFQPAARHLTNGLRLLREVAEGTYGKPFVQCSAQEQDAVLAKMREIPHPVGRRFLAMLVKMTIAGFLSAPRYGGNRGTVGWRFVGFEPRATSAGVDAFDLT
jgi:gluconate 2-dehydrogenase gamma chain